jgi:hypothetical protein
MRFLAVPLAFLAFHGSAQPLPPELRVQVRQQLWHPGCPVPVSRLRLLTVDHWGFDGRVHAGKLVVNRRHARPLLGVFRRLFALRFQIRRMGPLSTAADNTGSFECRRAAAPPCPGAGGSGNWSEHAYGEAIDVNPIENPYTACGRTRQRRSVPYLDRSRLRRGMVTPAVVAAFRAIGWGWGGTWTGVKDYMHFSASGH